MELYKSLAKREPYCLLFNVILILINIKSNSRPPKSTVYDLKSKASSPTQKILTLRTPCSSIPALEL